jgi:hypothetical protein
MKVFFTAALSGKQQYQNSYDTIINTLKYENVEVISRELQDVSFLVSEAKRGDMSENEAHYLFVKKGIALANAVVIEASVDRFQLGHEATLALLYNKPVLIVSQNRDYSEQIVYPKFIAKQYNSASSLVSIVKNFLRYVEETQYSKFNFIISSELDDYLVWKAKRTGLSKSDILREYIHNQLKNDQEYESFQENRNLEA